MANALPSTVFLRKLGEGCAMQLCSRQVCDLYVTHLTVLQKVALFYGSLNHFLIIWIITGACGELPPRCKLPIENDVPLTKIMERL